jgi:hypothetical protein
MLKQKILQKEDFLVSVCPEPAYVKNTSAGRQDNKFFSSEIRKTQNHPVGWFWFFECPEQDLNLHVLANTSS